METTSERCSRRPNRRACPRPSSRDGGVTQAVISAYESVREPGLRTLNRLIEATGHRLDLDLVAVLRAARSPRHARWAPTETTPASADRLCAESGARNVRVSGAWPEARTRQPATSTFSWTSTMTWVWRRWAGSSGNYALGARVDVVPAATSSRGCEPRRSPRRSRFEPPRSATSRGHPRCGSAIAGHLKRGSSTTASSSTRCEFDSSRSARPSSRIDPALLAREPQIPWVDVAAMRNHLTHRYFDTAHTIVRATVDQDIPPLVEAVERLRGTTAHR